MESKMLIKGKTQVADLDGDGVVDISDLTLAIANAVQALNLVQEIVNYINLDGPLPAEKEVTVDVKIGA